MFGQKGHLKDIQLNCGTLTIVGAFNTLELHGDERTLVFALVDLVKEFEDNRKPKEKQ